MSEARDRVWEYEGERRANFLRAAVVALFYIVELINRHGLPGVPALAPQADVGPDFHLAATIVAVGWLVGAWGVHALLRARIFPSGLKYLTTAVDAAFLTALLGAADGSRSPLVSGYLLAVALAGLRMNLPLVRFSAAAAGLGFFITELAAQSFRPEFSFGWSRALVVFAAIGGMALIVGQTVRRARAAAGGDA